MKAGPTTSTASATSKRSTAGRTRTPWAKHNDKAVRSHLFWVGDNRSEIDVGRRTLASNVRDKLNHPTAVKRKYDAAHKPGGKASGAPKKETKTEALIRENDELWAKVKALENENADLRVLLRRR